MASAVILFLIARWRGVDPHYGDRDRDRQQKNKVVRWSPWKIQTDLVRHIETNTFLIDQKSDCICHLVLDCHMERCISPLQRQRQTAVVVISNGRSKQTSSCTLRSTPSKLLIRRMATCVISA
jgi:hypothetical protein